MYTGIQHSHSYFAYLVLVFLLLAIAFGLIRWLTGKTFTKLNKIFALLGLIGTHLQVLIGLILYFVSPLGFSNFSSDAMGESSLRLYILEHPLTMILAAVLITVGYSRAKRLLDDKKKLKSVVVFYSIGLLLILIRIPWDAWGK